MTAIKILLGINYTVRQMQHHWVSTQQVLCLAVRASTTHRVFVLSSSAHYSSVTFAEPNDYHGEHTANRSREWLCVSLTRAGQGNGLNTSQTTSLQTLCKLHLSVQWCEKQLLNLEPFVMLELQTTTLKLCTCSNTISVTVCLLAGPLQ